MAWRHADQQRDDGKPEAANQVVEQMVAAVGPQRHLALTVVDRVQRPPPAKTVRQAVAPVFGEVQDQEIDQETEQWPRLQRREEVFELWWDDVVEA
jgi:hypothetical protein